MPNQRILVLNNEEDTEPSRILDDDSKALGFYGVRDWHVLKVSLARFGRLFTERVNTTAGCGHEPRHFIYRPID